MYYNIVQDIGFVKPLLTPFVCRVDAALAQNLFGFRNFPVYFFISAEFTGISAGMRSFYIFRFSLNV